MGAFEDVINGTSKKPTVKQPVIPVYPKPVLNPNLKLQAPSGKELKPDELPKKERDQYAADTREQNLQGRQGENFLATILRSPFRSISSVVMDTNPELKSEVYTPQGSFERFVLGDSPIKSASKQYEESKQTLEAGGYGKAAGPLAGTAVFGGILLDLLPSGGSKKEIGEQLVKTVTREGVEKILKTQGVADDVIRLYADDLARAMTKGEVDDILRNMDVVAKSEVPEVAARTQKKITENVRNYQTFGGHTAGKEAPNAALRDLNTLLNTNEGRMFGEATVKKSIDSGAMKVGDDGLVTLYRIGKPSKANDLVSATYDEAFAKQFSEAVGNEPIQTIKVRPEDVKYAIGGAEKEVLLEKDAIDPIFQEARKYKTAEEFVKARQTYYHVTDSASVPKIETQGFKSQVGERSLGATKGKGVFLYDSVEPTTEFGKNFTRAGKQPAVIEANVNGKIFDAMNDDRSIRALAEDSKLITKLKKEGYVGIKGDELGTPAIFVFDDTAVKTKSQLTDIWNKANAPSTRKATSEIAQDAARTLPAEQGAMQLKTRKPGQLQKGTPASQGAETRATLSEVVDPSSTAYKETVNSSIERTAKQVKEPAPLVKRVVDSVRKAMTNVIEYVQNSDERIRQLVNRSDLKIADESDPYLKATLYPGRVAEAVERGRREAEDLVTDMSDLAKELKKNVKTVRKQVNDYLLFKHAPERNAAIGAKAAGVTTQEAQAGLRALEQLPEGKKIKALADKALELNKQVLKTLKDGGVITDDLYELLTKKYKSHVPLQRIFEETDDIGSILTGKGFDVRSTGIKKAVGSEREVDDILANIVTNYEQAVLRAEKNIVDNATLKFARDNRDILGDMLQVTRPKVVGKTFDGKPILEKTSDPTVLQLFEKGKPVWIRIKDPNLAIALRGVGREKLGVLLNATAQFTRFYSGLATRFNPEFALPNKLRDLQETAIYLASQKGVGFKGATKAVARDLAQENTKAVIDFLRGADTEGAKLYKELKELGGTTGGFGLSTKQQVKMSLEKLEDLANSKTKRFANNLLEYVDNWNTIFEDSTRLSVYRQALQQGLSKQRAAFLAKEASINFNRMGRGGPLINALWMFSNASIQGSTKMVRSLKNPKVLGATVLAVGGATAAVNQWNDRVDPDWRDKVSKWDRLNGLPVVIPTMDGGVKYVTIPVSWGIKPIKVMSDYAYDAAAGEDFDVKKFTEDTMTAILEAYNPAGGSDLVSAMIPTIVDLPVEIARNRAWSGNKIKPDYDPNAPADIQYFDSLSETKSGRVSISISEALQKYAGIAVSPADINYAYEQLVGGAGRAVSKTVNTITGAATGKSVPADQYPFVSRFYRERIPEEVGAGSGGSTEKIKSLLQDQSRDKFQLQKEAERLYEELKKLPADEANARAKALKSENPALYEKLKGVANDVKMDLNYTERLINQLHIGNGERARYIWQELKGMKTAEEKNAYIKNLREKKVVSDEVMDQLRKLKNQ